MNVSGYLDRIGAARPAAPTAESLASLQLAHLHTVPFENLSIHWGEPIVLEIERLVDKIVARRRGGFCYELNGAFGALLRELGFAVTMVSAGVARPGGGYGPDFDHMALVIELDDRWLVDVGFGDSFLQPLLLDSRVAQQQGRRSYRIVDADGALVLEQSDGDGEWKPQHRFTDVPRELSDYEAMCTYHQTSPDSHFTQKRLASMARQGGRVTLSDLRLIETDAGGARTERDIREEDVGRVLLDVFGIRSKG